MCSWCAICWWLLTFLFVMWCFLVYSAYECSIYLILKCSAVTWMNSTMCHFTCMSHEHYKWTLICTVSIGFYGQFTVLLLFFVLSLHTVGFCQADICAHSMPFLNIYITADRIHIHGLFRIIQYSTAIWTPCRGLLVTVPKMSWCHFYLYRADKQFVFWGCYSSLMLICSCFVILYL